MVRLPVWVRSTARAEYDGADDCAMWEMEMGRERRARRSPRRYFERLELRRDLPFRGMCAPDRRASLSAIATACFRFRTLPPERERSEPCLYSRITLRTLARPLPRWDERRLECRAMSYLLSRLSRVVRRMPRLRAHRAQAARPAAT